MATRGRPPRKRSPSAGSAVTVKGHRRTPRGRNRGKPGVVVRGYKRGTPARARKAGRGRRGRRR